MHFFLITITLSDKSVHQGVRTLEYGDIDHAWMLYKSKAEEKWGIQIIDFSCVQLSTHSEHVKKIIVAPSLNKPRYKGIKPFGKW